MIGYENQHKMYGESCPNEVHWIVAIGADSLKIMEVGKYIQNLNFTILNQFYFNINNVWYVTTLLLNYEAQLILVYYLFALVDIENTSYIVQNLDRRKSQSTVYVDHFSNQYCCDWSRDETNFLSNNMKLCTLPTDLSRKKWAGQVISP